MRLFNFGKNCFIIDQTLSLNLFLATACTLKSMYCVFCKLFFPKQRSDESIWCYWAGCLFIFCIDTHLRYTGSFFAYHTVYVFENEPAVLHLTFCCHLMESCINGKDIIYSVCYANTLTLTN